MKYIGAFEPLVIRSLRQYTGTGDSVLQKRILQLLIQLIRLRVNYSMLDAEQVEIAMVTDGHLLFFEAVMMRICCRRLF